jgi:hypothetical protein
MASPCPLPRKFTRFRITSVCVLQSQGQSQNYVTTDGQSNSLSGCQAPSVVTVRQLRVRWCGVPSPARGRVCRLQRAAGLMIIFYSLRFDTPPTWSARSAHLYSPGTGWPSYNVRHWVPFSSPRMTRKDTVEVYEPASTRGSVLSIFRRFVSKCIPCDAFHDSLWFAFTTLRGIAPNRLRLFHLILTVHGPIYPDTEKNLRTFRSASAWYKMLKAHKYWES